jgi:hypothetical protein
LVTFPDRELCDVARRPLIHKGIEETDAATAAGIGVST